LENKKLDLNTIAKYVERSRQATCSQLTKLRLANVIRYEKKGKITTYWIKYPREVKKLLDACESLVGRITKRIDKDF